MHTFRTRFATTAGAVAIVALAAACTSESPGTATPVGTSSSSSATAPESTTLGGGAEAPKVTHPLNAEKFVANPCSVLTQPQLTHFAVTGQGEQKTDSNGPRCQWTSGSAGSSTGITAFFTPAITNGLDNAYQLHKAGTYKDGYFDPLEVAGYPAVLNGLVDDRKEGHCTVTVGLSDQSIFSVAIQGQSGTDGCKAATNVAKAALQTIQGGQ